MSEQPLSGFIPGCYCRDCKWWEIQDEWWERQGEIVVESVHQQWKGRHQCQLTKTFYDQWADQPYPHSKALVASDDGGELMTVPDFGCVQGEAR